MSDTLGDTLSDTDKGTKIREICPGVYTIELDRDRAPITPERMAELLSGADEIAALKQQLAAAEAAMQSVVYANLPETCIHGEEPDYCPGCEAEWQDKVFSAKTECKAALSGGTSALESLLSVARREEREECADIAKSYCTCGLNESCRWCMLADAIRNRTVTGSASSGGR